MMDQNEFREALSGLLGRNLTVPFAAECKRAMEAVEASAQQQPDQTSSYEIMDFSRLWAFITRLSRPESKGVDELFEGLIRAPKVGQALASWLTSDEHSFVIFTDENVSDIYGIIAMPETSAERPENDDLTKPAFEKDVLTIKVRLADGRIRDAEAAYFFRDDPEHKDATDANYGFNCVELQTDEGSFHAEGYDYFEALANLRLELEPLGIELLCFGARRDVWASPMQRDMGEGRTAYLLSYPRDEFKPQKSIFDYAPRETIGTVEEQREYAEQWLEREGKSQK